MNDIALIRLNEPIALHSESPTISKIEPICLPWLKNYGRNWDGYEKEGKTATVTGWGRVHITLKDSLQNQCKFGVATVDGVLREAKVEINNNKCATEFPEDYQTETKICVGGEKGKWNFFVILYFKHD